MHNMDWNDLRYLLMVARYGSVLAAARELGVNHTTVLRRINSFEQVNRKKFFIRKSNGYKPTPEGIQLLEAASAIEIQMNDLERRIRSADDMLSGEVKVTAVDSLCHPLLIKHLSSFTHSFPGIEISFLATNQVLNLGNRDSDVAIRPGSELPEHLFGYRVCDMAFHVYAHQNLVTQNPNKVLWLGLDKPIKTSIVGKWYEELVGDQHIVFRADSYKSLMIAAEQQLGYSLLPCFLGDTSPTLVRVPSIQQRFVTGLWVVAHKDLSTSKPIKLFMEHMCEGLLQDADLISGQRLRTL